MPLVLAGDHIGLRIVHVSGGSSGFIETIRATARSSVLAAQLSWQRPSVPNDRVRDVSAVRKTLTENRNPTVLCRNPFHHPWLLLQTNGGTATIATASRGEPKPVPNVHNSR